jgi:K+-transporting ATPase ATPase C chain
MNLSNFVRQHWAAFRALLVLTVITGLAYPLFIWLVAQVPGLRDNANGSIIEAGGKPIGSSLIGQQFTDKDGNALPQYFQSRPSAAGAGYDPLATSASNLGPESIVDTPADPSLPKDENGYKASLLTLVCGRSLAVGQLEGVDGSRPFCTGEGVGAVLSVIGPRDSLGNVVHPTKVVSVNEPCGTTPDRSSIRIKVCGSNAPSSVTTTRSVRSYRFAVRPLRTPQCRWTPSPPAAAAWIHTSRRRMPICR